MALSNSSWIYASNGYVSALGGQVPGTKMKVARIMDNMPETQYVFSALLGCFLRGQFSICL